MSVCWLHLYGIPMVNSPIGPPNDPVGLCQKCNSLSCGWHGVRTSSPGFLCVLCDKNSLFSSAAWRWLSSGGEDTLPADKGVVPVDVDAGAYHLALALGSLFSTPAGNPSRLVVATLEQWLAERPDYEESIAELKVWWADWAVAVLDEDLGVGPEPVVAGVGQAGQYDDYDDPVRSLWVHLDVEARRLMAAAVLLLLALDPTGEMLRRYLPAPVARIYDRLGGVLREHDETKAICQQVRRPQ